MKKIPIKKRKRSSEDMPTILPHTLRMSMIIMGLVLLGVHDPAAGSQTMRDKLQTTIAGAEYVVTGKVVKVEDDRYTLHTSGGETLVLHVTDDTNMFCQSRSDRGRREPTSMSNIGVSEKQAQSQESHAGQQSQGFRIGECPFQDGDMVKAELTDQGTVTFIRSIDPQTIRMGKGPETQEDKGSGRSTEDMGLPQEYVFLPAGALGSLNIQDTEKYSVKTSNGEDVGYLYKIILNSQGDPAYVIIKMKGNQQLKPLPWQAVQISPEMDNTFTLVISRNQIDQLPGFNASDLSMTNIREFWELAEAEKEQQISRLEARRHERFHEGPYEGALKDDLQYSDHPERGARPGEAGEFGEVSIFGSPSTLPPGEHSPGYTGADRDRKRH